MADANSTCRQCSAPFIRTHGRQVYCSAECRQPKHAKELVPCSVCGNEVTKYKSRSRTTQPVCSHKCRNALRFPYSKLPENHWAIWFGRSSSWPKDEWRPCIMCAKIFPANHATAKYCTKLCLWRWKELANGATPYAETASQVRQCERCGKDYQSAYVARVHCTDYCRDKARDERGSHLHHGWIRPGIRNAIYQRDNYTCWLCNEPVDTDADAQRDDWAPTLDHIIPRSQGGTHDESNLKTAHRWCNSVRSDSGALTLWELAS